jgi:hypothetical protein
MKTVQLSDRNYRRLSAYAKVARISTERAINDACNEWMDSRGDILVAYIKRTYLQPVPVKGKQVAA